MQNSAHLGVRSSSRNHVTPSAESEVFGGRLFYIWSRYNVQRATTSTSCFSLSLGFRCFRARRRYQNWWCGKVLPSICTKQRSRIRPSLNTTHINLDGTSVHIHVHGRGRVPPIWILLSHGCIWQQWFHYRQATKETMRSADKPLSMECILLWPCTRCTVRHVCFIYELISHSRSERA